MNTKLTILLTALILATTTLAGDYPEIGNYHTNYNTSTHLFSTTHPANTTKIRTSYGKHPALVADLNGDGINEIIHNSGTTLRIYHNQLNTIVGQETTAGDPQQKGNMQIFDIDADGNKEIITLTSETIEIYRWDANASQLNKIRQKSLDDFGQAIAGDYLFKCKDTNTCLLLATTQSSIPYSTLNIKLLGASFGLDTNTSYQTLKLTTGYEGICFPRTRTIDIDNTGNFVLATINPKTNGQDNINIYKINLNATQHAYVKQQKTITDGIDYIPTATSSECTTGNAGKIATSAITEELDDNPYNGEETAISFIISGNGYATYIFDNTTTLLSGWTSSAYTEGLGNILAMQGISESTTNLDTCTQGYSNGTLSLFCTNADNATAHYETYTYDATGYGYNLTNTHDSPTYTTLKTQHASGTAGLHEIINSFGTFKISGNSLTQIYSHEQGDAVITSADTQGFSTDDFILVQPTLSLIKYLDDGNINNPATISNYTIPCTDRIWAEGTTATIMIEVTDETDKVSARMTAYEGDANEQDSGWSAYTTTINNKRQFHYTLNANKTGTYNLAIRGRDEQNPSTYDELIFPYTVATEGANPDDCTTHITGEEQEDTGLPDTIGGTDTEQLTLQTELVNVNNPEEGLLPNFYQGTLQFFSYMIKPLIVIAIGVLILLIGGLILKSAKRFAQ